MTTEYAKMNPDSLFEITATRIKDGKEYTYHFYRVSKEMPTRQGKPMKPKEVFGSKARVKVAKEDWTYIKGTELFSIEDVGIFFKDRPTIEGDANAFSNFRLTEIPLPVSLESYPISEMQHSPSEGYWQESHDDRGAYIVLVEPEELPF